MEFPLYRKFATETSYYKLLDDKSFIEIKILGSKYSVTEFEAKIFPDFNLIKDLIEATHWVDINANEFEAKLDYCKNNLTKINA